MSFFKVKKIPDGSQAQFTQGGGDVESGFEVLKVFHEWEIGLGYVARLCKIKAYEREKLEIRIFRQKTDSEELKPLRMKIDFPWEDDGSHTELLAFFIAGLMEGASVMGIDLSEYVEQEIGD